MSAQNVSNVRLVTSPRCLKRGLWKTGQNRALLVSATTSSKPTGSRTSAFDPRQHRRVHVHTLQPVLDGPIGALVPVPPGETHRTEPVLQGLDGFEERLELRPALPVVPDIERCRMACEPFACLTRRRTASLRRRVRMRDGRRVEAMEQEDRTSARSGVSVG